MHLSQRAEESGFITEAKKEPFAVYYVSVVSCFLDKINSNKKWQLVWIRTTCAIHSLATNRLSGALNIAQVPAQLEDTERKEFCLISTHKGNQGVNHPEAGITFPSQQTGRGHNLYAVTFLSRSRSSFVSLIKKKFIDVCNKLSVAGIYPRIVSQKWGSSMSPFKWVEDKVTGIILIVR